MRAIQDALEDFLYWLISPALLCKGKAPQASPSLSKLPLRLTCKQKRFEFSTSHLSDEEILNLLKSSPMVDAGAYIDIIGKPNRGHVARITSDVVAKFEVLPPTL